MRVKQNDKIDLRTPRFVIDNPLNDEMEKYDVFKHINRASATAFVGTSGSGKTSLMYSLLMNTSPKIWKKQFEYIIVVMPRASRNSLKNNIFDKYLDPDSLYDDMTEEAIDKITAIITNNAEEGHNTLLILDDVASALKNPYITKKLQHLVYAYRHYRLNILILVQTLKTIPLSIRKNLTNLVVFHKPRLSEWEAITHEFLEMGKDQSQELYETVFKEKYDWTLINLNTGRIYSKFDEVIYKED
jgi:ABC-type oligopeptide transport system ATPase subunit